MWAPSIPWRKISRIDSFKSQTHDWPVEVKSAHIIGDEECALNMISVDGNLIEVLALAVGAL